jgi:hypothetical protein
MRRVVAFVRAILLGTILSSVCVNAASADFEIDDEKTALFFSGRDLWYHGAYTHGGLLWSPRGLDHPGFTLKLLIGGGVYRYVSGALGDISVMGYQAIGFALPGWRFQRDRLTISWFAGVDVQRHQLFPDDPSNSLRGTRLGLRGAFDLWLEPKPGTMISADLSVSSIGPSYSGRLTLGWQLADIVYVGPEIGGFANGDSYSQLRFGLHVTGVKVNDLECSIAFGWAFDNDDRGSLYGRLGVHLRR